MRPEICRSAARTRTIARLIEMRSRLVGDLVEQMRDGVDNRKTVRSVNLITERIARMNQIGGKLA